MQWGAAQAHLSRLDLFKGYWNWKLDKASRKYFRFEFDGRLYQCCALPQGATVAPRVFQSMMEDVLKGIPNVKIMIDDILVGGASWSEHIRCLRLVLQRLQAANLKLGIKKCSWAQEMTEIFGWDVSFKKIAISRERVRVMAEYPKPTDSESLGRFVRAAGYFRSLIPHFAEHEAVLGSCMREWDWTNDCETAFAGLRQKVSDLVFLYPYDPANPIELWCDASGRSSSANLLQRLPTGERAPVCFSSNVFTGAQLNYSAFHREFLAVLRGLKKFHYFLEGKFFEIYTDHEPLVPVLNSVDKGLDQLGPRWVMRVIRAQSYQFKAHYVKGIDNVLAVRRCTRFRSVFHR